MTRLPESILLPAMQQAAAAARKWMGATNPNPPVGAVALNKDGTILAVTAHQRAGEPHAEALLIEHFRAQNTLADIHTLCITLEPCNHHGRTPPCVDAIIESGIQHLAIATMDPNPHVAGGGAKRLLQAGIDITFGVNVPECEQLIHAFAYNVKTGTPWVTLKRALDQNGAMIPPAGMKTFTAANSLLLAHRLRKKADAILTGSGTVLTDNPLFTVRHIQDQPTKHRWLAILDRRRRVPATYLDAARQRGLIPIIYQDVSGAIDDLKRRGAIDILVEAGPALSQSILESRLWTMSVLIRHDQTDEVEVEFNTNDPISFDVNRFRWDYMLPT
jgi:diaminohydroxyphosphoribosylaminopyrimidine deaminase/5-amino-6-(5-phosphoribosylamino)uracil reductase